jgi:predicted GH43/DUF377 family glycosyl hydrolase
MNKIVYCVAAFFANTWSFAADFINLDTYTQDFILENKQIIIPQFPGAFNASIIRWKESLLMCFRVRNEKMVSTFEIGLVWLDDNFDPIGTPRILEIKDENPSCQQQKQDPRLIIFNDKLYIVYSNFVTIGNVTTRRMFIASLHIKEDRFYIVNPTCLHPFENCSARWEKNWVPFVYEQKLLLAYSLVPHRIFQPSLDSGECTTHSLTHSLISWNWGELRGGTPAIKDGDEYIAFFHSSINLATTQSDGKVMPHYVMGAYTFSAKPPFEITRISTQPIVTKRFYDVPYYTTWKPLRVVFPMGFVMDKDYIWVTYGRQDFEIWVAKMDKKHLYSSLTPCSKIDPQSDSHVYNPKIDALYNNYVSLDESS